MAFCFASVAGFSAAQPLDSAQPYSNPVQYPPSGPTGPNWGDPYQIVSPAGGMSVSSSVMPTAGLFGHGNSDPYATPPTAAQLNSPAVNMSSGGPIPVINGPLFQGGPIYNSMQNWDPLFPRFRNQIDTRLYLRTDYLLWDASGMNAPPLVTTSPTGTPRQIAAVLGEPGTAVLFGGTELNDGSASGFLFSGGFWVAPARNIAIESEFFQLGELNDKYNGSSDGSVILGRPFFDIVQGQETAELISFPGLVSGNIQVDAASNLRSFLFNGRIALCPTHGTCCQQCGNQDRTDWIIGYRNIRLRDSLTINENLRSELSNAPGTIAMSDQFQTTNQFNGIQLGLVHRRLFNRAWLESMCRVAVGNMEQTVQVAGSTTYDEQGVVDTFSGGLLAQRTNIGIRSRDEFSMVPELGIRLGMRLTNRLHASLGYSVLYLPNVLRASEQIDTDLNPGLIPEELDPFTGALRPRVLWTQSDYLAHGLSFGGELHF